MLAQSSIAWARRLFVHGVSGGVLVLLTGCSVPSPADTFTFTADLPPDFYYKATAVYVPAQGQTCSVPGGKKTKVQFNRNWRNESQPNADVKLYRTVSGCPLVLRRVEVDVYGTYSHHVTDFGADYGQVAVRYTLDERRKGTFNAAGESVFYAQCQWLFRTSGTLRRLVKILDCKDTDAQGNVTRWRPFAAYTLDQLPGKTVRLKVTLADQERPFMQGEQLACPVWGSTTRFQLVDEFGSGQPYAGLTYQLIDYEDVIYTGKQPRKGQRTREPRQASLLRRYAV